MNEGAGEPGAAAKVEGVTIGADPEGQAGWRRPGKRLFASPGSSMGQSRP